jgi:hypothetical protein
VPPNTGAATINATPALAASELITPVVAVLVTPVAVLAAPVAVLAIPVAVLAAAASTPDAAALAAVVVAAAVAAVAPATSKPCPTIRCHTAVCVPAEGFKLESSSRSRRLAASCKSVSSKRSGSIMPHLDTTILNPHSSGHFA